MSGTGQTILHATAVSVQGRGLLIRGASGSGKSALALQLMALGAGLIADDRVQIEDRAGTLWLTQPPGVIAGIEARGVGLLGARLAPPAALVLAIDMDLSEQDRLPQTHRMEVLGHPVRCLHNIAQGHFPAAIMQYMHEGPLGA